MSSTPLKVAVTGAAGQIGYSLLFRLASGSLLGADRPIELRLLEIEPALKALEGVVMELDDCAFPSLAGVQIGADPEKIFDGVNLALLVGARPRGPGMERSDLLEANGAIFTAQGKALNQVAADDVRIGVTGNPANTNALIAMTQRPRHPAGALLRADPARPQPRDLAARAEDRRRRHRHHQDDDLGQPLGDAVPRPVPRRGRRRERRRDSSTTRTGWRTPSSRPSPSAVPRSSTPAAPRPPPRPPRRPSTPPATGCTARPRATGSRWPSRSDGSYGVQEGLISSFPVTTSNGDWSIVQGLEIDDFSRGRIDATVAELAEEKDAVTELGLI